MTDIAERIDAAVRPHVERGEVTGLAWAVSVGGEVHRGAAGSTRVGGDGPVGTDSIFRIASLTKPVVAVAALMLVEEGVLRLDDPLDRLIPELAGRRVLAPGATSIDDTVPAVRPITLHDVLTFRLGWGVDLSAAELDPVVIGYATLELGAWPIAPQVPPPPDEWIRRLATLPLQRQPGERWQYHIGSEILGVIVARTAGCPLDRFLDERIFGPLGMVDTGFSVPAASRDRFGPYYGPFPDAEGRNLQDDTDGQWSTPPAFPSGGGGLVSTAGDYLAFGRMLLAGGVHHGRRLLSAELVEEMTTNQLTPEQITSGPDPSGARGWGLGVGVQVRATATAPAGSYGWTGGLGSSWSNDPARGVSGVLLTNEMLTSFDLPPTHEDFWLALGAASGLRP